MRIAEIPEMCLVNSLAQKHFQMLNIIVKIRSNYNNGTMKKHKVSFALRIWRHFN